MLKQLLSSLVKWEADGVSLPQCILCGDKPGLKIGQLRWGKEQEEVAPKLWVQGGAGIGEESHRPASPCIANL